MRQWLSQKKFYKFTTDSPEKQKSISMERRSKSRVSVKEPQPESQRSQSMAPKSDHLKVRKLHSNHTQTKLKQNMMISLANIFMEYQNDPCLIHPWMKQFHQLQNRIIGTNYVIVGPAQSGKYSAVKYALGVYHKNLHEILIDCDFNTTEYQIFKKLLDQFRLKCRKWELNEKQIEINKLITPDNIDFSNLNPYIEKAKIKFVIVIKNGQHLVGFKKQSILYSLFEWMSSEAMQRRAGLVILSRDLRIMDRFQKRIKSRFCGNRLCIFRPQDSDIYIKILTKRIEAVLKDKEVWNRNLKLLNPEMEDSNQQIYQSDDESNIKRRLKFKQSTQNKMEEESFDLQKIITKNQKHPYMQSLNKYYLDIKSFLSQEEMNQFGIQDFFKHKIIEFDKSKNKKKEVETIFEQTVLSPQEQIECLGKLKEAIAQNKELIFYFGSQLTDYMILTIPMILQKFQSIFIMLDETLIKILPVKSLKKLIFRMLKNKVEIEFTNNNSQSDCLQNINNVELLILILIIKETDQHANQIKLTKLYHQYKDILNKQIQNNTERSSNKIPIKIVQRSIDRLYRAKFINYDPRNIWNSSINLTYEPVKIKQGLRQLAKKRQLNPIFEDKLKELNIISAVVGEVQDLQANSAVIEK